MTLWQALLQLLQFTLAATPVCRRRRPQRLRNRLQTLQCFIELASFPQLPGPVQHPLNRLLLMVNCRGQLQQFRLQLLQPHGRQQLLSCLQCDAGQIKSLLSQLLADALRTSPSSRCPASLAWTAAFRWTGTTSNTSWHRSGR